MGYSKESWLVRLFRPGWVGSFFVFLYSSCYLVKSRRRPPLYIVFFLFMSFFLFGLLLVPLVVSLFVFLCVFLSLFLCVFLCVFLFVFLFAFLFVFLSRTSRETDLGALASSLQHVGRAEPGAPLLFLIFPEGTDFHPAAVAKSREFAAKNGLPGCASRVWKVILAPGTPVPSGARPYDIVSLKGWDNAGLEVRACKFFGGIDGVHSKSNGGWHAGARPTRCARAPWPWPVPVRPPPRPPYGPAGL